jgi:hypothetical protein
MIYQYYCYPLVMTNIAIEHGHRPSEFSHEKWVDLSIAFLLTFTRPGKSNLKSH